MARYYHFYRGVDNEIEFKGLRGTYFYYAGGLVMGGLLLCMVLYMVGIPMLLAMVLLAAGCGGGLFWVYQENDRHGRYGRLRSSLPPMRPRSVVISQPMHRLIRRSENSVK